MSRYKNGLRTPFQKESQNYRRGIDRVGGPWVATPGYIRNEVVRLDTEMLAFDADARAKLNTLFLRWVASLPEEEQQSLRDRFEVPVRDSETGGYHTVEKMNYTVLSQLHDNPLYPLYSFITKVWGNLYDEWDVFNRNHDSWHENMWGSTIDTIESYRNQLKGMRDRYNRLLSQFDEELDSPEPEKGPEWAPTSLLKGAGAFLEKALIGGAILVAGIFGIKALQGRSGSSVPSLPSAQASSSRPRKQSKGEAQRERVLAAMERKEK